MLREPGGAGQVAWLGGGDGLLAIVLVAPVATFLLEHLYVAKLGRSMEVRLSVNVLAAG